ncbi:MAG: methionyl-tRNA formyltransferase [Clostridia bacterium]|nr:methionyl-tRNA formyltransferase [Clostridia bacterium]
MNIVWIGFHNEGVFAFRRALEMGKAIVGFVTLDDAAFLKRSAGTREYLQLCEEYNVPVHYISTIKSNAAYSIIQQMKPDLSIVLGWSEIVPQTILEIPTVGTVGAHASLLPHNRGSAPVNWSIINGEEKTGNTLMWLNDDVDAGEIIDQVEIDITPYDTCATIYDKVAQTNATMIIKLIERLECSQYTSMNVVNKADEPILPRRRPKDGEVIWTQSSRAIYNFVRALTRPYPGAFSYIGEKKYLIWSASLLPDDTPNNAPGAIIGSVVSPLEDACGILVTCQYGSIILHEIEDESGNIFKGHHGFKEFVGAHFEERGLR